jgi:hypothetical protein
MSTSKIAGKAAASPAMPLWAALALGLAAFLVYHLAEKDLTHPKSPPVVCGV